jgi:SAM-dependent methyltransferase
MIAMTDLADANGYDANADAYIGSRSRAIGVSTVLQWASDLDRGAAILDVGCGHGDPIALALHRAGFAVHGIDRVPRTTARRAGRVRADRDVDVSRPHVRRRRRTQRESISLGADVYRALISAAGLELVGELEDEGDNHDFSAAKR